MRSTMVLCLLACTKGKGIWKREEGIMDLNRRQFLKGGALVGGAAALAGVAAGCTPSSSSSGSKSAAAATLPAGTVQEKKKARTGYVVETYKVYRQNGAETRREWLCTSTYPMIQQVIEYN